MPCVPVAIGLTYPGETMDRTPTRLFVPVMDTVPGYESASWQGLVAPARTPPVILDKLHRTVVGALNTPDLRKRLTEEGSEIGGMPPAEFATYIRAEIAKWARVVREANIKVE